MSFDGFVLSEDLEVDNVSTVMFQFWVFLERIAQRVFDRTTVNPAVDCEQMWLHLRGLGDCAS